MIDRDIRSAARAVVEEILDLNGAELRDDGDFFIDYGCTSLRFMGLVVALERRFGVRYDMSATQDLTCLDDVVRLTEQHAASRAGAR
jgi:acyl carrier protein